MVQPRNEPRFVSKADQKFCITSLGPGQHLDRDRNTLLAVTGRPHLRHAAPSDRSFQLERTKKHQPRSISEFEA